MRSDHPVPARCGLYFFEVKVVSSGNDGFIGETGRGHGVPLGRSAASQASTPWNCSWSRHTSLTLPQSAGIGFATADVVSNRLPGWEEHSYGYHGDDGHSFCGSGQGRKYGPTYSTGAWLDFYHRCWGIEFSRSRLPRALRPDAW